MGTFAFLLQFPSKRSWCFSAFRATKIKGIHISLIKSSRSVLFVVLKRNMIINRKFPFDIFLVER